MSKISFIAAADICGSHLGGYFVVGWGRTNVHTFS
jgi:hypothetical protein